MRTGIRNTRSKKQSARTAQKEGNRKLRCRKKVKGRNWPIAVDTLVLADAVISAGIQDRIGVHHLLLRRLPSPIRRIQAILADGAYSGSRLDWIGYLFRWILTMVSRVMPDCSKCCPSAAGWSSGLRLARACQNFCG